MKQPNYRRLLKQSLPMSILERVKHVKHVKLVNCLKYYLDIREKIVVREVQEITICFGKLQKAVTADTVPQWMNYQEQEWILHCLKHTAVDQHHIGVRKCLC